MSNPLDSFLDVLLFPNAKTDARHARDSANSTRAAVRRIAEEQGEALDRIAATQRAAHAASEAESFRELAQVAELQKQLCATALYCRALLQLLVDKNIVTVDEFEQRMVDIDMLDGKRDGR